MSDTILIRGIDLFFEVKSKKVAKKIQRAFKQSVGDFEMQYKNKHLTLTLMFPPRVVNIFESFTFNGQLSEAMLLNSNINATYTGSEVYLCVQTKQHTTH